MINNVKIKLNRESEIIKITYLVFYMKHVVCFNIFNMVTSNVTGNTINITIL